MVRKMNLSEMGDRVVELRKNAKRIPAPSMRNYTNVIESYKELLDEILELLWHMTTHTHVVILDVPEEKK